MTRPSSQPSTQHRVGESHPAAHPPSLHPPRLPIPALLTHATGLIRYFLHHPKTPRPLRFSRLRALRHWTIHRAWQLERRQRAAAEQGELERQYNSMREACEALRLLDDRGMSAGASGAAGKEVGRLYRLAMEKKGVWQGMPIEYARPQTDYPSRDGWFHGWTR
jgi:large subunit ribosomal protein L40